MTTHDTPPRLTPDGPATRQRRDTDETERSDIGRTDDPELPGDGAKPGYSNTDEVAPDSDGLVRGDDRAPLI